MKGGQLGARVMIYVYSNDIVDDVVATWPYFMDLLQVAGSVTLSHFVICFALLIVSCHECHHTSTHTVAMFLLMH